MKKITILFLTLLSGSLIAQIPNPSFENWTSGSPNGWYVLPIPGSVSQSANAHAGTSAVELNTVNPGFGNVSGTVHTGTATSEYFINSGNFSSLSGWYILNISGGDVLFITLATKCAPNTSNGAGFVQIKSNSAVYKQFTVPMTYGNVCTSDSAFIEFSIIDTATGFTNNGTFAIIDDLQLGPAGINEISNSVTLEKAYPNPANTECNIIYSLPSDGIVNIALYDISGRKIETLLNNEQQSNGRYKLPVDVSGLASGIYVYTITVNGQSYAQKLTVSR
jgi:hypothetical protein